MKAKIIVIIVMMACTSQVFAVGYHVSPKSSKEHALFLKELQANVKTIALIPTTLPDFDLEDKDGRREEFHELLTTKLERFNYKIIPAEVYGDLWQAAIVEAGGIYDPVTGVRLEDRYNKALTQVRTQVIQDHNVDAFLETSIQTRLVGYSDIIVRYGGVKEKSYLKGAFGVFGGGQNVSGMLSALVLRARLVGSDGELIFGNYGGIQLLTKRSRDGKERVPKDQILQITENNKTSIHLALRHMLYPYKVIAGDIRARSREEARD